MEAYIVNELRKTYLNNGKHPNFYYYRDNNQNEIDLVVIEDGTMHCVECKIGMAFGKNAIKAFRQLSKTNYRIGTSLVLCNTEGIYPIDDGVYATPIAGI